MKTDKGRQQKVMVRDRRLTAQKGKAKRYSAEGGGGKREVPESLAIITRMRTWTQAMERESRRKERRKKWRSTQQKVSLWIIKNECNILQNYDICYVGHYEHCLFK